MKRNKIITKKSTKKTIRKVHFFSEEFKQEKVKEIMEDKTKIADFCRVNF
jgi:hypothetical protein